MSNVEIVSRKSGSALPALRKVEWASRQLVLASREHELCTFSCFVVAELMSRVFEVFVSQAGMLEIV
jgi:hypothetical protein